MGYTEAGSGPVALFVHGVFLHGGFWSHQLADLSDVRHCVAVDLLGHGRSGLPGPGGNTLAGHAEALIGFLDALGVEEFDLVANDTGGAVAQLLATTVEPRLRTLTLTNCDTSDNLPPAAFLPVVGLARRGEMAPRLPIIAGSAALARSSLANGFEHPETVDDSDLLSFAGSFADPARALALEELIASLDPTTTIALDERLAELHTPTLIVWGTGDVFFDVAWARWLERTIPGTRRVVEVEGAKLFFPFERPAALTEELRRFWSEY
jgi:pimeloyl-ACP methyl ester carboxylesterase